MNEHEEAKALEIFMKDWFDEVGEVYVDALLDDDNYSSLWEEED